FAKLIKPLDGVTTQEEWSSSQQFLNLTTFLPPQYLPCRLYKSGFLYDWWKYFMHLGALAPGGLQVAPTDPSFTMQGYCAQIISRFSREILGEQLEDNVSRFP
ncbi:hypothetical protein FRC11_002607, partial [Ceratobasidium sp. 423]